MRCFGNPTGSCARRNRWSPQLSDEQLAEASQTASGDEFTGAERFVGTFLEHPSDHLAQVYRERGDTARAQEQERATVQVIGELLGRDSTIYGHTTYNLGCIYARTGEAAQAIAAIGEALRLIPSLVEFSRHDAELDALREIPAFQALYTRQRAAPPSLPIGVDVSVTSKPAARGLCLASH